MRRRGRLATGTNHWDMVGFSISLVSIKSQCPCQLGPTLAKHVLVLGRDWSFLSLQGKDYGSFLDEISKINLKRMNLKKTAAT